MPAEKFTKKADTAKKRRAWEHVYESVQEHGGSKEQAIRAANAQVKKMTKRKLELLGPKRPVSKSSGDRGKRK